MQEECCLRPGLARGTEVCRWTSFNFQQVPDPLAPQGLAGMHSAKKQVPDSDPTEGRKGVYICCVGPTLDPIACALLIAKCV